MKKIDRRRFLQLAGAAMLVGAAGSLTGCAESSRAEMVLRR